MSNTQAAAALSMAAKTVESHLGRIYAKLGIVSGVQLAAAMYPPVTDSRRWLWLSLSTREQQVATAIASGLTNRQAGRLLFVSPKTIEYHLGWVYRKLQIGSRRQLPAIVAQLTASLD
jgi:DNA-binding CsgD family transcriptional regulator